MRRTKTLVVLVIAALAVGFGYRIFFYPPQEFRQVDVAGYESDMTEALLSALLQDTGTNGAAAYFLAFGHRLTPPTDAFLGRFSGHRPPVRSYAASRVSRTGDIVDSSSGEVGVLIQLAKIERKSDAEFDVEAALSNLPASSNRFIYTVVQREGRWVVKSRRPYG
jgi:hypothetical protein